MAVSGKLIDSPAGSPLPLEYVENTFDLKPGNVNPPGFRLNRFRPEQQFVRTVYLPIIRFGMQAGPGELQQRFDFTQPAEFAGQRATTTVPTQALFLLNSKLMKDRARDWRSSSRVAPATRRRGWSNCGFGCSIGRSWPPSAQRPCRFCLRSDATGSEPPAAANSAAGSSCATRCWPVMSF